MTAYDKTDQIDTDQNAPKAEVGDADRRHRDGIGQGGVGGVEVAEGRDGNDRVDNDQVNAQGNDAVAQAPQAKPTAPKEYGGRKQGLDPTRYGDWEKNGRCIDF